jgi:hypothetical protein
VGVPVVEVPGQRRHLVAESLRIAQRHALECLRERLRDRRFVERAADAEVRQDLGVADRVCVMAGGNVVESGTPREVFYDDALLERANLHPPTTVRIVRDVGLDDRSRPVTEADLVALLADGGGDAVGRETSRIDHADRRRRRSTRPTGTVTSSATTSSARTVSASPTSTGTGARTSSGSPTGRRRTSTSDRPPIRPGRR